MKAPSLRNLITHNFGLKALSLLAACALWFNIAREPELATIVSVPVDYRNFPKDLVISSNIVDSISVEARGPASRLREMQQTRVAAVIDFATVHGPGERTFTLSANELQAPRGVTLVRAIPQQLRFQFERQTSGDLPVEVSLSGALPRGLSLGKITVDPPTMTVTGPTSSVADARRVLTDPFDLSRITAPDSPATTQSLATFAGDAELRFVTVPRVTVKVRVERTR